MFKVIARLLIPAFIIFALTGCGGSGPSDPSDPSGPSGPSGPSDPSDPSGPNFTSSYAGCWQGTWTPTTGLGGTLNITVAGDGSWTGILTISTPGSSGAPINFCRAVSGTSDNTSMTTSYMARNATTNVSYTNTFTGTFIPGTGHMKGSFVFTTTDPGGENQAGSFDLTPYDCPYQGHWTGTWEIAYGSVDLGSLNLVIAKDGSINGTNNGSNVCGIVTKDNSNGDLFTMNYNPGDGSFRMIFFLAYNFESANGKLTGIWTCLDDESDTGGLGGFTLQQYPL